LKKRRQFLRDFEAGHSLDLFLLAAVTAVLGIRFALEVTGYPSLGGTRLHIAHMLWGGLLMMAAVVLALSYLGRRARRVAALVGGFGFGTFIDELGKFVTRDNDYFYQPTVALIYGTFVLLYLTIRSIHRERIATREEYLVNALREFEEVAVGDLSRDERDRAIHYLQESDPEDPLVDSLTRLLLRTDLVPAGPPNLLTRAKRTAFDFYRKVAALPGFTTAVVTFFVAQLVVKIAHVVALVFLVRTGRGGFLHVPLIAPLRWGQGSQPLVDWAQLGSSLLSGVFVALGVVAIRRSRLVAFRMFQRSILVSIFLTQVFIFYREQWSALLGLGFNIAVFLGLRFMIERERESAWQERTTVPDRA
jgi:hypothetical protein